MNATMLVRLAVAAAIVLAATPASAHRCEIVCRGSDVPGAMHPVRKFCTEEFTPGSCKKRSADLGRLRGLSCHDIWVDHCPIDAKELKSLRDR
jgi:hypothetical protein